MGSIGWISFDLVGVCLVCKTHGESWVGQGI